MIAPWEDLHRPQGRHVEHPPHDWDDETAEERAEDLRARARHNAERKRREEERRQQRHSRGDSPQTYASADVRAMAQELLEGIGGEGWYKALFYKALRKTHSMAEALDIVHLVMREMPPGWFEAKHATHHERQEEIERCAREFAAEMATPATPVPVVPTEPPPPKAVRTKLVERDERGFIKRIVEVDE